VKDPARRTKWGRVAPERGGPSRKRRPSRLFGIGKTTSAQSAVRNQSLVIGGKFAAQRPNKNGTLARRAADGRCGGKQSDDKAVAPSAQRRQSKRMRGRRPHDKKRGKSACGSEQESRTLRSAQRGTECVRQESRSASHAPDRHPQGQDYKLGSHKRIERVAFRQRQNPFQTTFEAGISGPSHTRLSKSACFGSSSTSIPSTLRTLISSEVYSGSQ
jgi:hypothetical protein